RGYNVQDLVDHATFEEVAFLLLYDELPNAPQLAEFADWLESEREVPATVYDILKKLPPESTPMDWLKIGVAALGLLDETPESDSTHTGNLSRAVRLTAKLPALVANGWRVIHGEQPNDAEPGTSHA